MANITNNFEKDSCVFQAGSSMFGDVHMEGSTIYQGVPKEPQTQAAATGEEEEESPDPSPRGRRKQFLFFDGKQTVENVEVRRREVRRFCGYLSDHKLGSRELTCLKDDALNDVVICFLLKWMELGLIDKETSGGAIFRFLTEECGLRSSVTERSYSNEIKERLRERRYTVTTQQQVRACFKE